MAPPLLEMAKELVMAQIETHRLSPEAVHQALRNTHATLLALQRQEAGGTHGRRTVPAPVDWRRSITRQTVTCLECGMVFKQLSGRHLRLHGLDSRSYRTKYGIPRTQALASRETSAQRRRIAQRVRMWEKRPGYRARRRRSLKSE